MFDPYLIFTGIYGGRGGGGEGSESVESGDIYYSVWS